MKRSSFKPKLPPARPVKQYDGANPSAPRAPAVRIADQRAHAVVGIPKREYVRSRVLLDNVRLLERCNFCFRIRGVMACHSNWAIHGKGKSVKADDNRIAAGCDECHRELDQGNTYTEAEKQRAWWVAHKLTVCQLLAARLWPADVPVPDIEHYPEQWSTATFRMPG